MPVPRRTPSIGGRRGTPRSARLFLISWVALALAAGPTTLWPTQAQAQAQGPKAYGVAVTPRNFPNFTIEDVDAAFKVARRISDYAVFIYQWGELDIEIPRLMVEKSRQAGLEAIIGLSPTSLGEGRKELDLPDAVRARAGSAISFANPVIREAFKQSAVELARLQVPYLCLATEINFLAMQRLDEYLHFVTLYKETHALIKQIAPTTRVFVSFQWEWMRILDAREPLKIAEHKKVVDIFRPDLDVVGLTTYPSFFHPTPADLVPDYYSWLSHYTRPGEEVLMMEVGWPTKGSGNEKEQRQFIRKLPKMLSGVNVSVLAWALLHDVGLEAFDADLNTVGLITIEGQRKLGFKAFKKLHGTLPP